MKRIIIFVIVIACFFTSMVYIPATAANTQFKGVWVCSKSNIDFPSSKGLSVSKMKSELDEIVKTCKKSGLNAIFFQVRPNSDALYKSEIFPWSSVLTGTQGKAPQNGFDPLAYIIDISHKQGIELHAWINPYRVGKEKLCAGNPAYKHPEYTVKCSDGFTYYNPAFEEVRRLIVDGVKEIVRNYDVDGIHFDDYFYPYGVKDFPDSKQYEEYGKDFSCIEDFRRNNVNLLIKETYKAVHSVNSAAKFGVSPFGIWDNKKNCEDGSDTNGMSSYCDIYADSRAWVINKWVDYICPQLYWSFEHKKAPFEVLCDWWNKLCSENNVKLYIGIGAYKLGTDEVGWDSISQIKRQQEKCKSMNSGIVYFCYSDILKNTLGLADILEVKTATDPVTKPQTEKKTNTGKLEITSVKDGYTTTNSKCSVSGVCDAGKPLTMNGKTVSVTENGYFSEYVSLEYGKNTFVFSNGDKTKTITIIRKNENKSENSDTGLFISGSEYPAGNCEFFSGECVEFRISLNADAKVFVVNDSTETEMKLCEDCGTYKVYSKHILMPNIITGTVDMGKFTFYAVTANGETVYDGGVNIKVISSATKKYTSEEANIYNECKNGSMMDNYSIPASTPVQINGKSADRCRMLNGKWISADILADAKSDADADIDTDKYTSVKMNVPTNVSYYSYVTDGGALVIDIYGDVKLKNNATVSCEKISNGQKNTVVMKLDNDSITGYLTVLEKGTLTVWIYNNRESSSKPKNVVIDVGHGGKDTGASGPPGETGDSENDLNLSVATLLKQTLESKGMNAILTRADDLTLPLAERSGLIRSYSPDISVSIHHNSVDVGSNYNNASGITVLYSRETSKPLCDVIGEYISDGTGLEFRGVKKQSLNVCRDYRYPCVLIECGFICNPSEYEKIISDEYEKTLCNNIAKAVCEYFK